MKKLVVISALLVFARPPAARGQDVDAMMKWGQAQVLHWHVVGEFAGKAVVFKGTAWQPVPTTDRVELDFDWNNIEQKLIGKAVFKNFPSRSDPLVIQPQLAKIPGCEPPRLNGPFEYFTMMDAVSDSMTIVELKGKRDYPGGAIWFVDEISGKCGPSQKEAGSETASVRVVVPPGVAMATPGFEMTRDRRSIITRNEPAGWTWTLTPGIVR